MRRCIISFASDGREHYSEGIKRLIPSAIGSGHGGSPDSSFLIISPDLNVSEVIGVTVHRSLPHFMPSHQKVPYGFKPWLFKMAFDCGYDQVLWCDSTIIIHKPLDLIWKLTEERGLFIGDNPGCPQRFFTSDDAMNTMGCPYEKLDDGMFWQIAACALAIDIRHQKARQIFGEWFDLCNDGITFLGRSGSSRPEFRGHRHDQSAMSWLVEKHGIKKEPYGMLCYHHNLFETKEDGTPKFPEAILVNTGIGQV